MFISIPKPIRLTPLAALVLKTPCNQNPVFVPTTGEYKPLGLTKAKARCFVSYCMHISANQYLHVTTDALYDSYLAEAKKQGWVIQAVTELLFRYKTADPLSRRGIRRYGKISTIRVLSPFFRSGRFPENPALPLFRVPVENTPESWLFLPKYSKFTPHQTAINGL